MRISELNTRITIKAVNGDEVCACWANVQDEGDEARIIVRWRPDVAVNQFVTFDAANGETRRLQIKAITYGAYRSEYLEFRALDLDSAEGT